MPILPPRQEQASGSAPSAGATFGATFGGIILFSLFVLAFVFWKRRGVYKKLKQEEQGSRRDGMIFDSEDTADEKEPHSSDSDSTPTHRQSNSQSMPLLTLPASPPNSRPAVSRLTIPASPGFMKTAFLDQGSAVSSACMNSSESAYSQFPSAQSATLHAGPSKHYPFDTTHAVPLHPYGMATSDVTAAAVPLITSARPRRSLHPFSGANLLQTDASRMRIDAIMELPSPFIFHPDGESVQGNTLPVSPMPRLSEELDSFIEMTPAATSATQSPETPGLDAYNFPMPPTQTHVPPLIIAKAKRGAI
ncbi:hypothetical protein DFH09DRAFT_1174276 [Mycena vulgaris]|nr:hypothetical protein DFH09DRAFT_1174276 [Mycena vulgaris]